MTFKTLVIASDFPAFRYTNIPKKTEDLFKAENLKDLASKIIFYLKNPDEEIKIENYARKYVEKEFNWKILIAKYKDIYIELIRSKN